VIDFYQYRQAKKRSVKTLITYQCLLISACVGEGSVAQQRFYKLWQAHLARYTFRPMKPSAYVGRFAPSPTGPLHAGSLVAALASWLDARAHGGRWLVRIEDIDPPRCPPGMGEEILRQLLACHLVPDEPPQWQSARHHLYAQALAQLQANGWAYACGCTRRDMEAALIAQGHVHERHGERPYPGTCRDGLHGKPARSWRFHTVRYQQSLGAAAPMPEQRANPAPCVESNNNNNKTASSAEQVCAATPFFIADQQLHWHDQLLGDLQQDVASTVGDFLVQRVDGLWAYQLAVVVDDAEQAITDVVRGADLADNTPRQLLLQHALGLPAPRYMHTPLVLQADGEKLSKQYGAPSIATGNEAQALAALQQAGSFLGLQSLAGQSINQTLEHWIPQWAARHVQQLVPNTGSSA
jgi:glutamyl-Q tRNA(Asp) synthetase